MLKETETEETIDFFVTFLSIVSFQFGIPGCLGLYPWLRPCKWKMKGLSNLVMLKGFEILAINSFKWFYKHANGHLNGVKLAIFFLQNYKICLAQLRANHPAPVGETLQKTFSFEIKTTSRLAKSKLRVCTWCRLYRTLFVSTLKEFQFLPLSIQFRISKLQSNTSMIINFVFQENRFLTSQPTALQNSIFTEPLYRKLKELLYRILLIPQHNF